MNVDCKWIEDNGEALFCDGLTSEQDRLVRSHLESCFQCREKIADLKAIDPEIREVFKYDLAMARIPRPKRSPLLLGAAGTALAAAAILIAVNVQPPPAATQSVAPPSIAAAVPETAPVPKTAGSGTAGDRAKPEPSVSAQPGVSAADAALPTEANAPEFLVSDLAGYSRTLNDYRGYTLIFGIWSADQPQTAANLEHIYKAVGANTKLRVLGVSQKREAKPAGTTFPTAFNQGSSLLGAAAGQFVVVNGNGKTVLRGNLLDEPATILASIRTVLK